MERVNRASTKKISLKTQLPSRKVLLEGYGIEADGLSKMHLDAAKQLKRLKLEEMKLLQLLSSLRRALPADSPALQDDSEELQEALAAFQQQTGEGGAQPGPASATPPGTAPDESAGMDAEQGGGAEALQAGPVAGNDSQGDTLMGQDVAKEHPVAPSSDRPQASSLEGEVTGGEEENEEEWEEAVEEAVLGAIDDAPEHALGVLRDWGKEMDMG